MSRAPHHPRRTAQAAFAAAAAIAAAAILVTAGCSSPGPGPAASGAPAEGPADSRIVLPPAGAVPDYQLGGAYDPAPGVGVVGRDRTAQPAPGVYSICYVNGFQTQPDELDVWPDETLLRGSDGELFVDPDWPDEVLLDTSTASARDAIHAIISEWVEGCARDGFDAVEFDNLDSYTRADGELTLEGNLALASALVDTAHRAGLAAGQKNSPAAATALRRDAGFDFAVTEECSVFGECADYTEVYGDHVIDIEYTDALPRPFTEMCAASDAPASMVLRDKPLSTPDDPGYAFETCPAGS
ncbi:hypothetical protein FB468_2163 [Leucobacter komagatae]|uniref:Glycoside-hydrolase family GH114 TIM-barrel domain-containing protein n=1 Tax=Leucobacter komagatae TaxID=55969 RepID=A0A542Y7X4_9MICO|nr:endo alpha-1,4 polygalactosaminidase [Leucobacter komagatae]TQL44117.1 hypothetical protein FB468_2163 [Leucobacter komagatae]